jgi:hypothetical protein
MIQCSEKLNVILGYFLRNSELEEARHLIHKKLKFNNNNNMVLIFKSFVFKFKSFQTFGSDPQMAL